MLLDASFRCDCGSQVAAEEHTHNEVVSFNVMTSTVHRVITFNVMYRSVFGPSLGSHSPFVMSSILFTS